MGMRVCHLSGMGISITCVGRGMRLCIICFGMGMKLKIYFEYLIEVPETSQPRTNMRSHWTITVHGGGAQQIQISFFKLTVFVISISAFSC